MGQSAKPRRQKENEAKAYSKYIKSSAQKLNLVAAMIRGKKAGKALTDLKFSTRRVSQDVYKVLASAIANAENNHGLDVDRLIVSEAVVGKTLKMKRFHARGRGRAAQVEKKFSNLMVVVREEGEAVAKKAKKPAAKKEQSAAGTANKTKAPAKKPAAKAKKSEGAN